MRFAPTATTDPRSVDVLDAYFADRAATRPSNQTPYRATHPDPAHFEHPRGEFVLAHLDGELRAAACGGIRRIAPEGPWRDPEFGGGTWFELKHVFVRPDARGDGRGRELLEHLIARAWALGADRIVLDTNSSLDAAARLYASLGFTPIRAFNENANADTWLGLIAPETSAASPTPPASAA